MATENQVVIEQQGFLPDTSDEISPSELSKRKKVVDFFCRHKLVFIAVICGIIVGVLIGLRVCNLTHQQEAEDNGNTTICNRTNEEGSSNALSNQINQQNAQDKIIDETPSPNTSYSSLEKCYYETPEGSQLVKTICWTGKEKSGSSHACTKCTDGSILPSICFCDEKVNCVNDAKLFGSRAADHSKKTCSWCKTIFNKQFKDQGNANCSSHNQPLVDITCKDGYSGSMCNVITALLCKFKNGQSILKECNTSKLEECTMKSTLSGNYYHCKPFTDSNIGETKGKKVCYLDAVP
ncbi:Hypothetical predicted protein [Mytilus galloprovincialis]|uniref:Uncharacterized protein n=1 Tax=Mytilus galloprovincialis TaxID=29158 RepID=A0A8B6CL37_MYTGA|nr:Hypothetical predicted protein [Mytilus galloprovincialis]